MRRLQPFLIALSLVLFAGAGCRSIDPKAQARTDALLQELSASAGDLDLPDRGDRLPWAVGQWVAYRVTSKGKPGVLRYAIVGREGGAFWLEIFQSDYYDVAVQKWLVSGIDPADPESIHRMDLRRVLMWKPNEGEAPIEMPAFTLGLVRGTLEGLVLELKDAPSETVTVPAGTVRARVRHAKVQVMGIRDESKVWLNGAVPIWNIVRTESTSNDHRMELIAFGTTGAPSEMP